MEKAIEKALENRYLAPKSKNEMFLLLTSLNLLNAAIKQKEYKKKVAYGQIKKAVSCLVEFCVNHHDKNLFDDLYFDAKAQCVYIRCFGIQFSFHNIGIYDSVEAFIYSPLNQEVAWDGVRLQPIALPLFQLATECYENQISDLAYIKRRFEEMNA